MYCKVGYGRRTLLECTKSINLRFISTVKERWDLVSSVCLERKPIITKELSDFELTYSKLVHKVENELSYKSDHEIRKMKDKILAERLKKEGKNIDSDQVSLQTAQEFEDLCNEELKQFNLARRTTASDIKSDVRSTNRQLSETLMLVTNQNIGKTSFWGLPQGLRQEGETMRHAAERVLHETCGKDLRAKFFGNAPCGFYKYRYPKKANIPSSVGMKIFFFKASLVDGHVSDKIGNDFQWLSVKELDPIFHEDYLKSVRSFVIDN